MASKQGAAAKQFAERWKGKGYEKGQAQPFWLALLREVYGVEQPEEYIHFEDKVHLDSTAFIDGMIPATHVMIEQKSCGKSLTKEIRQSDGTFLTPFRQAQRYSAGLPYSQRPRWIVTCNFEQFNIYDMEQPDGAPETVYLKDLEKEYYRLGFLIMNENAVLQKETEISIAAGTIVGLLYDAFAKQYADIKDPASQRSLNVLCVRLVFCLYAEDAGIFGRHNQFHDYLAKYDAEDMREALIRLFRVLDTPVENRDRYLKASLGEFPYVNGGLFADEDIEVPPFTDEIRGLLLDRASVGFDWSQISPTIFGAVFESTLNPDTRRSGGMHYTSIENIHKVIDPLFLDDLQSEYEKAVSTPEYRKQMRALENFQEKLASLKFLDPAAGSGNFLTETYLCLRRLENKVIAHLQAHRTKETRAGQKYVQMTFGAGYSENPIKVSISQFYGIEINDFAVTVARTALWISENQTMQETERIVHADLDFLPLKTAANIVEGNALRMDWNDVVPKSELNYLMGNPPFVGARLMTPSQKKDVNAIFDGWKNAGNLDYVACWYKKAADMISQTYIRCALVSTNSVSQGDAVATLWEPLFSDGVHFDFARRTFRWDSEANLKAHVHCVIIGFSKALYLKDKVIYDENSVTKAANINGYLVDAPSVFVSGRKRHFQDVPQMDFGNMPNDGGHLCSFTAEQKDAIVSRYPLARKMFRRFVGASEFLHNRERWCLWLKAIDPSDIKSVPPVMEAIQNVREVRLKSTRESTRKLAETPTLFGEIRQPSGDYLIVPRHSSQTRRYIPIGYVHDDVICGDANMLIPTSTLYHFGVLESNVHMSWMRAVCGRIKSDYRYSKDIVYNNFPWPEPSPQQRQAIEKTAQMILDARALYPNSSLADLYDPLTMPPELLKAHKQNDKAVMSAYGISKEDEAYRSEAACVALLMTLYTELARN